MFLQSIRFDYQRKLKIDISTRHVILGRMAMLQLAVHQPGTNPMAVDDFEIRMAADYSEQIRLYCHGHIHWSRTGVHTTKTDSHCSEKFKEGILI